MRRSNCDSSIADQKSLVAGSQRPRAVGHCRQRQGELKISAAFLQQPVIELIGWDLALVGS
jgi:hypothetical protein